MKRIFSFLFALLIILFPFILKGQSSNQLDSMINHCLAKILKKELKAAEEGRINKKVFPENYYVFTDHFPPFFELSLEVEVLKMKYISIRNMTKKQKKKGLWGIELGEIKLNNNLIRIPFYPIHIKQENKKLLKGIGVEEVLVFIYEYSCEKQDWILIQDPTNKL